MDYLQIWIYSKLRHGISITNHLIAFVRHVRVASLSCPNFFPHKELVPPLAILSLHLLGKIGWCCCCFCCLLLYYKAPDSRKSLLHRLISQHPHTQSIPIWYDPCLSSLISPDMPPYPIHLRLRPYHVYVLSVRVTKKRTAEPLIWTRINSINNIHPASTAQWNNAVG